MLSCDMIFGQEFKDETSRNRIMTFSESIVDIDHVSFIVVRYIFKDDGGESDDDETIEDKGKDKIRNPLFPMLMFLLICVINYVNILTSLKLI